MSAALLTVMTMLAMPAQTPAARSGCLTGNVLMAMGVNGTVTVCPQYDAKVPELQKQLNDMQKTLSSNQDLLREVTHSARSVTSLGRDVDANRQVELLRSFNKELQKVTAANQQSTQKQIADLADKLDAIQDRITQNKEDQKTAPQTQAALNGPLGDAIAKLDFTQAQAQLDSIQAKLDVIGSDVKVIKETELAREAREKAAADAEAKKAKELDEDPNMYTRAQIMPLGITPLHYMVFFYSRPPLYPLFVDSQFSIAFHKGSTAWRVDATDKAAGTGGELWKVNFDEVGDRATICFVAHDKPSGRLKEWMQRYKLTPSTTRAGDVNWVPEGDASMRLTDGGPCDGVTQVRKEVAAAATPAPAATGARSATDQYNDQMAQLQQRMAQAQQQARTSAPPAQLFAKISADGARGDHASGDKWQIKVTVQPSLRSQFFDVQVQANLLNATGQVTPLQLSNRQLLGSTEIRDATTTAIGTKAVMCVTAKDPRFDKLYRLTQWFNIETSRVYWNVNGAQVPGEHAAFVPSQPATITEASNAECR